MVPAPSQTWLAGPPRSNSCDDANGSRETLYYGGLHDHRYRDLEISPISQMVTGKVTQSHKVFWARRKSLPTSGTAAEFDSCNAPIHLLYTCSRLKQGSFRQCRTIYKLETACQFGNNKLWDIPVQNGDR